MTSIRATGLYASSRAGRASRRITLIGLIVLMLGAASLQVASAGGRGYKRRVLANDPVAYWRLNETSGSVAYDKTGRFDGTYLQAPTIGEPGLLNTPSGHSVWLDGSDQRIVADSVTQWTDWPGYTLEAWVRIDQVTKEEHILAFNEPSGSNGLALLHDQPTGAFKFRDCEGSGCAEVLSSTIPQTGQIYYLAVTVDKHDFGQLFVNGQEEATFTSSIRPLHDALFSIGSEYDGDAGAIPSSFFRGNIDEVAIYNHSLPDRKIRAHYQAGLYAHGTAAGVDLDALVLKHHLRIGKGRPILFGANPIALGGVPRRRLVRPLVERGVDLGS